MRSPLRQRWLWPVAGLLTGWLGLLVSWFCAQGLSVRSNPVVAVSERVTSMLPQDLVESGIQALGSNDKTIFVVIVLVAVSILSAVFGWLARAAEWRAWIGWLALALIGAGCVADAADATLKAQLPVAAGLATWLGVTTLLTDPLRSPEPSRRFVLRAGVVLAGSAVLGVVSPRIGRARRRVEAERASLKLTAVTAPSVPAGADLGLAGPWMTPASRFYRVDTAFSPPAVLASQWSLRIHGMVEHELRISFADLLSRERTEDWMTLNCVSNPVGGPYVGNAWWSGVRVAALLAEAGVQAGADAVLQTSADGWTCGTPLAALTDSRNALLAVAMNGEPLPLKHGFPVRTVVPGLFGYVSACKWVVDLEVTTMDQAVGYWITRGWAVRGPVKVASRIDRPSSGAAIEAGSFTFAGVAWEQETGISAVEVSLDGSGWHGCELGRVPDLDTWVQWKCTLPVAAGSHRLAVRATDRSGKVQTAVVRDVVPDGATGWHTISFSAS